MERARIAAARFPGSGEKRRVTAMGACAGSRRSLHVRELTQSLTSRVSKLAPVSLCPVRLTRYRASFEETTMTRCGVSVCLVVLFCLTSALARPGIVKTTAGQTYDGDDTTDDRDPDIVTVT